MSALELTPDGQLRVMPLSVIQELIHERNKLELQRNRLRKALQSVMDWNPKPEYWERPETAARFEADMARARKVLEETE